MTLHLVLTFCVFVASVSVLWNMLQLRRTLKTNREVLSLARNEVMTLAIINLELATRVANLERDSKELIRRVQSLEHNQRTDPRAGYIPGIQR